MNRKENNKTELRVILRPASSDETGLFYSLSKEQNEKFGTVGHLRIDFGSNGHEFWHSWWPRDFERPYSSAFESDLKMLVDALRDDGPLESFSAMQQYCSVHGGKIEGSWQQNYGLISQRISMLVICVLPLLGIRYPKYMKSLDSRWFELIIFRNSAGNYYFLDEGSWCSIAICLNFYEEIHTFSMMCKRNTSLYAEKQYYRRKMKCKP